MSNQELPIQANNKFILLLLCSHNLKLKTQYCHYASHACCFGFSFHWSEPSIVFERAVHNGPYWVFNLSKIITLNVSHPSHLTPAVCCILDSGFLWRSARVKFDKQYNIERLLKIEGVFNTLRVRYCTYRNRACCSEHLSSVKASLLLTHAFLWEGRMAEWLGRWISMRWPRFKSRSDH